MKKYLHNLHEYSLYIFIFFLPWHTIYIIREVFYATEKWQYGTIGIYISDITLVIWIILSIYLYKDYILKRIFKKPHLLLVGLLLSLWSFVSIMWAADHVLAFYFTIKLSFALDLFFLVQIIPLNIHKLSITFFASVFIQSLIGIYQFTTQNTFAQKFLGLQHHDVFSGGNAIVQTSGERWLRAYGGAPHPNIFGVILLAALLFGLYILIKKKYSTLPTILALMGLSIITANILYTFSRVTWLTSLLCIFTFTTFVHKSKKYNLKQLLPSLLLITLTALLVIGLSGNLFFKRISQDTVITHNSISDRALYISQSKLLILSHPIIGTGIGNYTNTLKDESLPKRPLWQYQPVHNIYLLIISEIGFIGFILFAIFIIIILYTLYADKKNITLTQATFIIVFIGLLFISLFDHLAWTSHFGLLLLFLTAGLSLRDSLELN